ncbi:TIM barrel protein [Phaeovibrio sulfidiphilus]|uniref:TIM barrel protein n=1 Tax=Phaeovibrio sulfidiphilus TaxID=1220600 RepID=A0A8J6YMU4_9PROT|nr:TIM barrel protein [Phaeovibrio sulfidiphilus]MBE1237525.1 TIM barrel protein [Phaeovibrio sulfidiphilus]
MPRFSANLARLFTEHPLDARIDAARACGFGGVEIPLPYIWKPEVIGDRLAMADVELVCFSAPPGDWAAGERGLAALPGRESEFRDSIEVALEYADLCDCTRLLVPAGIVADEAQWPEALDTYIANLSWAAERCSEDNVRVLIEPKNTRENPGYFLSRPDDAVRVLEDVDDDNLCLCYNMYHAQIIQGGLSDFIEENLEFLGHVRVAGVPLGDEPDRNGEINWPFLFTLLDAHGYPGWVGCDYTPRAGTVPGLRWGADFGLGER